MIRYSKDHHQDIPTYWPDHLAMGDPMHHPDHVVIGNPMRHPDHVVIGNPTRQRDQYTSQIANRQSSVKEL